MRLIGLCGKAGAGKDTFAKFLIEDYGFKRIAFADPVRDAVYAMNPMITEFDRVQDMVDSYGWEFVKRAFPESRRLLQAMGTEVGRSILGYDVWVDLAARKVEEDDSEHGRYVITDCRFPNEVEFIKERLGQGSAPGLLFEIVRETVADDVPLHVSEKGIGHLADYTVRNTGTLDALRNTVHNVMEYYGIDPG